MAAIALGRWGLARAARWPVAWAAALTLVALVPLLVRLSPFAAAEIDASAALATAWVVPIGLLALLPVLVFLTRAEAVLERLAPRARLAGELSLLLAAPVLPWALLGAGAGLAGAAAPSAATLAALAALAVHQAGLALAALRLPVSAFLRLVALWGLAWALPALLGFQVLGRVFDLVLTFDQVRGGSWSPTALILPVGVLLLAAWLPPAPSRTVPR